MTNPFDDPQTEHRVVVNDEGQHALWPAFASVPDGWESVHGPAAREECLDYVDRNWTDLTPRSARIAVG
ncbi:MbtH family protein [Streptomyces physcomitrii]|uniref:MbtH family protein n=1 Tax=Streptomyces physcomitrii TaxID=2724184 RepID=A0ABX1H7N7_9ACTN|nr:MbtH family protein [Streptomyces physcomitrii]NKI44391.1 MbtH family protein [Streptomyces physcomitrii]